jgi:glycerol-3-phosphate dehydrogenase (NAD(P)+)
MEHRVAVVGAGSWGTAIASIVARNAPTVLWARSPELAQEINATHRNQRYLPSLLLPESATATSELGEALQGTSTILLSIPSHGVRSVLEEAASFVTPGALVFSLIKGVEEDTLATTSQIIAELVPQAISGVVTGPNLASEIALGLPAACVVASSDPGASARVQAILHSSSLRAYSSRDVIGCEVAGATKNVIALASGIVDGMEMGQNARAALMSRGLAEMSRLCVALGGQSSTVSGLAGVGDLVVTCTSPESRNRQVGIALGRGRTLTEVVTSMHTVAEGVRSAGPLTKRAAREGVEMPICEQVALLVAGETTPRQALASLMDRPPGAE